MIPVKRVERKNRVELTAQLIRNTNAKERESAIELRDSVVDGLICRIRPTGRKTFELVWKRRGQRGSKTLGIFDQMTVKAARIEALKQTDKMVENPTIDHRNIGKKTLRAFAVKYFEKVNLRTQQATRRTVENDWAELLDLPLRNLRRDQIEDIRSRWLRSGNAPATVNRKSTVLRGVLSRAVEWGDLHDHPMKGIKPLPVSNDARVRTLSAEERGRLYGVIDEWDCDSALGTGIYLLLNTGIRMGELRGLRQEDVDMKNRMISIRAATSKVAKSRRVPINQTLAERLAKHGTWVALPRKQWAKIMRRARIVANFTPHHCRHDFLSRLANSNVPMHIVAKIAGHSSITLTARYYVHESDKGLRDAVESF